jgi:ABC-type dipeptide/oligopeptide/nickel transport system permease subunit
MARPGAISLERNLSEVDHGSGPTRQLSPRSLGRRAWATIRNDRLTAGAALVLILVALMAIFAPVVCPYPPNEPHILDRLAPPGTAGYLLGTDGQGRDMLSRLIMGTRTSLALGLVPVFTGAALGLVVGCTAAFLGGVVETILMRFLDVLFGLPPALLAILVAACLGPGLVNMLIAMTVVIVPPMGRVAYQTVTRVKELPFIEAARATGASQHQILIRHIVPSALPPVIVFGTSLSGLMIVFGAGLSFVGLGIQPPTADWGRMINDGRIVLPIAPHVATLPGLAIFIVASAFSLLGEALRDILDPRARLPGFAT